ncbi:hypothetical protein PORY_002368 [Pneumocystis oryctolagi]|uniref:Uncharacterized protein n=1 Tax=Pneumocystis oryctolagi TaxID=42067 RepID=A0ACB7C906_9ASCO|nr:hypothetical protein PORY_002368 [Pneumocystis oryctolagi]
MIENVRIGLPFSLNSCRLSKDGIIGVACGTRIQLISWNTSFQSVGKNILQIQDVDFSSSFEEQRTYTFNGKAFKYNILQIQDVDFSSSFEEQRTYTFNDKTHFRLSESTDTFIKEIDWSPTGISESKNCVLAILTSKNQVYIFKPYKSPYFNKWVLLHNISKINTKYLESLKSNDVTNILRSRSRCILWSSAFYTHKFKWGKCYLCIGNEYGEIELWSISSKEAVLNLRLKVLETWVIRLAFSPWIQENSNTYCCLLSVSGESGPTRIIKLSIVANNEDDYLILSSIKKLYIDNEELRIPTNNILWFIQSTSFYLILIHIKKISIFQCSITCDPIFIKYLHTETLLQSSASGTSIIYNSTNPIGFLIAYQDGLIHTFNFSEFSNEFELIPNDISFKLKKQLFDCIQTCHLSEFDIRIYGLSSFPPFLYHIFICEIIPSNEIKYTTPKQAEARLMFLESSNISNEKILKIMEQFVISSIYFSPTCILWDIGLSNFFSTSSKDVNFIECFNYLKKFSKETSDITCRIISDRLFNSKFLNSQRLLNLFMNIFKIEESFEMISQTVIFNLQSYLTTIILSEFNHFNEHIPYSLLASEDKKLIMLYCSFIIAYFPNNDLLLNLLKIWKQHFLSSESLQIQDWIIDTEEYCIICKSRIPFKNIKFGTCEKKHTWPRCSITLFTLMDASSKTCQSCSKKLIFISNQNQSFMSKLVNACDICFYCGGRWYSKI